jgi:hypothetical protein
VTLSPKKLNKLILIAIATPLYMTVGVVIICVHPRGRSKKGDLEATEGSERMGKSRRMEMVPKRPSNPTATRGETL